MISQRSKVLIESAASYSYYCACHKCEIFTKDIHLMHAHSKILRIRLKLDDRQTDK